jgi:hypothetical protein
MGFGGVNPPMKNGSYVTPKGTFLHKTHRLTCKSSKSAQPFSLCAIQRNQQHKRRRKKKKKLTEAICCPFVDGVVLTGY